MDNDTLIKIVSTKECLKFLEKKGISPYKDSSSLSIKSEAGLIFEVPSGEVVLIPTNLDLTYPGIIFKNKSEFEIYKNKNYFPIGEPYETWLETNFAIIEDYKSHLLFFKEIIKEHTGREISFIDLSDFKSMFQVIQRFNKKETSIINSKYQNVLYCFGFLFIDYLSNSEGFHVEFEITYENYNPIKTPILVKNGYRVDFLSRLERYLESNTPQAFDNLMASITK